MKFGVFPFALNSPAWGVEGVLLTCTLIVAQCTNYHPWTTAVTPCGWNLHALPANWWGVELTKSNSWWHTDHDNICEGERNVPVYSVAFALSPPWEVPNTLLSVPFLLTFPYCYFSWSWFTQNTPRVFGQIFLQVVCTTIRRVISREADNDSTEKLIHISLYS